MKLYRYALHVWLRIFGGQGFMAWLEEKTGKIDGKFTLTRRALALHSVGHALLSKATCVLTAKT
jgi:hypothetical protein